MAGFDFTQCVGNLKRGNASKHTKNANVLMNSSTLWYGGPKTGKTTILAKTFNNTDYVMLDFDNNYDEFALKGVVVGLLRQYQA